VLSVGKATLTMLPSIVARKMPIATADSTSHLLLVAACHGLSLHWFQIHLLLHLSSLVTRRRHS
jgi:hypothetical protein